MASKVLSVVGAASLLVWTLGGCVAWFLVKERIQVVVSEGPGDGSRDVADAALLREDVASLRRDLQALASAMSPAATPTPARTSTPAGTPAAPAGEASTAADEAGTGRTQKPTPRKSFLSFRLPSQGFRFDQKQRFEVIPALSRVGFDGESTLHTFTAATSDIRGSLVACLAHPDAGCSADWTVQAASLISGHEGRDQAMCEHLATSQYRQIRFHLESFKPDKVDPDSKVVTGTATGDMTIRGVTRRLSMPVKLSLDEARRLRVDGEAKLNLRDYKVPVPNKLGVIKMYDEVRIWIAVRARCLGPAGDSGQ